MNIKDVINKLIPMLWATAIIIGITSGLLAFAVMTVRILLRMIGVI